MEYKIAQIKLTNIRNVKYGDIEFVNLKKYIQEGEEYHAVSGIYGQNASGKTSSILAIEFLQELIDTKKTQQIIGKNIIHEDFDTASIELEMIVNDKLVKYEVGIKRDDEVDFVITNESLASVVITSDLNPQFPMYEKIIDIDYENENSQDFFTPQFRSLFNKEYELDILMGIAQENRKSFFSASKAHKLFAKANVKEHDLADEIAAVYGIKQNINVISDHDSSSNNVTDDLMLFNFDYNGEEDLTVNINVHNRMTIHQYEFVEKGFKQINDILRAIVPSVEIVIEKETFNDKYYEVSFYSKRKGVNKTIPLSEESYGIKKIISMAYSFAEIMNKRDFVLIIDELDAGIFEYLLGQIVNVLNQYSEGQVIFTSHNLRAVEILDKNKITFSTVNPENAFIKFNHLNEEDNLRDAYYRAIKLGGTSEKIYDDTYENDIFFGMVNDEY